MLILRHAASGSRLVSLGAGLLLLAEAAGAQEGPPPADAAQLAPVCMTGTWRDVEQVRAENKGKKFPMVVAARDVPALQGAGFEIVECKTSDLASEPKRTAWRDQVCEMAAYGNEAVQNQLERALGARPAVLCGSAELAVGQWHPKAKSEE